ncbi:hypothetical protein D9757_000700 [Collybiopsis confluens]|uniref:Uncharacterized protein n=1 Tax=Collybiopsis confluens TaxID=2823264 RepID=A0A8H5MGQ2_9AGAR|nr:hypothetical protein D9757_000700 [Collybiopsis confluens]
MTAGTRTILNLQTLHENGTASPAGGPKDLELTTIGNFPTSDGSTFSIHDRQPNPRNVTYST